MLIKKHPSEIILRGLRLGLEFNYEGQTYVMSDDNRVGIAYGENKAALIDWNLNDFLMWTEKIPEQIIMEFLVNITLNTYKPKRKLNDKSR